MKKVKTEEVVTLKKIGGITNLSVATVSDILNNNPKCFAGKKTKERVISVARELGYHPNLLYRSLRKRETHTIGLIVPNLYVNVTITNIELIELLAWDEGYHIFIGYSRNNSQKENALLKDFLSRRADGIILVVGTEGKNMHELNYLLEKNYPFVTIGKFQNYRCSSVTTDYYAGGKMAAKHLLERGCKKLGIFGYTKTADFHGRVRKDGFKDTVRDYGMETEEFDVFENMGDLVLSSDVLIKRSFLKALEILHGKHSFDGIFASNDDIALGLINAALRLGVKIPEELAVVGFDDSPSALASIVPITTIRQKREEIARNAFKILKEKIQKGSDKLITKKIRPELIVRSSTDSQKDITEGMGQEIKKEVKRQNKIEVERDILKIGM